MRELYFKPTEVAEILKSSEGTLANWRCQRKGPPFTKAGGSVLYPREQFEEWLANRLVDTTSAA